MSEDTRTETPDAAATPTTPAAPAKAPERPQYAAAARSSGGPFGGARPAE